MNHQVRPAIRPWKSLGKDMLLSAAPWLSVYRERVELPSGRVIDDFYRVVMPDLVVVVPVTDRDEVVMVRGYKHGVGRVTLCPPAGLLEPGEAPLGAAQRELGEETGYEASGWESLGSFVVDGNRGCGKMHLFLARGARWARPPQQDDTEELQVELMSRARLREALATGEIGNLVGASAVALALVLGH